MLVRLTETERKVAELYAKGMRPREIADRLGISINTVYKALSKARKTMEAESPPAAPHYYAFTTVVYVYPSLQQTLRISLTAAGTVSMHDIYDVVLKKLDEILTLLKGSRQTRRLSEPKAGAEGNGHSDGKYVPKDDHMPEALRRNVWISLLRSKAT